MRAPVPLLAAALALVLALAACTAQSPEPKAEPTAPAAAAAPAPPPTILETHPEVSAKAIALVDRYLDHLRRDEYDAAYALLSEELRQRLLYEEYLAILRDFFLPEKYQYRQVVPGQKPDEVWVEVDVGMSDGVQRPYRYTVARAEDGSLSVRWFARMKGGFDYPVDKSKIKGH